LLNYPSLVAAARLAVAVDQVEVAAAGVGVWVEGARAPYLQAVLADGVDEEPDGELVQDVVGGGGREEEEGELAGEAGLAEALEGDGGQGGLGHDDEVDEDVERVAEGDEHEAQPCLVAPPDVVVHLGVGRLGQLVLLDQLLLLLLERGQWFLWFAGQSRVRFDTQMYI